MTRPKLTKKIYLMLTSFVLSLFVSTNAYTSSDKQLYKAAITSHMRCQQQTPPQKKKTCLHAAQRYRRFIRAFPHHKKSYALHWYLGDVLYHAGSYTEAIKVFQKVRSWPHKRQHRAKAASSILYALRHQMTAACRLGHIKRGTQPPCQQNISTHPLPFPSLLQAFQKEAKQFFQLVPKTHSDYPVFYSQSIYLYFLYGYHQKSRTLFRSFSSMFPTHRATKELRRMILPHHARMRLKLIIKAEQHFEQKEWKKAAVSYEQVSRMFPHHRRAAHALWNAQLLYEEVHAYKRALTLCHHLLSTYPLFRFRHLIPPQIKKLKQLTNKRNKR